MSPLRRRRTELERRSALLRSAEPLIRWPLHLGIGAEWLHRRGAWVSVCAVAFVQDAASTWIARMAIEHEIIVLSQKGDLPAVLGSALRLVFRALVKATQPSQVVARRRVNQKDIDLMMGDTDFVLMPQLIHGAAAQEAESIEISRGVEPNGEIDVFRFVYRPVAPPRIVARP